MFPDAPHCRRWTSPSFAAVPVVGLFTASALAAGPAELADYWPVAVRWGWFLVGVLAVVVLGRLFVRPALARFVRRRNRNNPTLRTALRRYVDLVVLVVAIVVGTIAAGYGHVLGDSALLLSAIALAIGVAAQEVIGSLVSGLALVLDPEFNVGDYIEWANAAGIVQAVALRTTRVETPDGDLVTIPNTVLTEAEVSRPYGRGKHRIVQTVGIDYEDDLDRALATVESVAASLDTVLADPAPTAYVDELADDEVVLRSHYWIEDPDRTAVVATRSTFARRLASRLEDAGITVSPAVQRELTGHLGIEGQDRPLDPHPTD